MNDKDLYQQKVLEKDDPFEDLTPVDLSRSQSQEGASTRGPSPEQDLSTEDELSRTELNVREDRSLRELKRAARSSLSNSDPQPGLEQQKSLGARAKTVPKLDEGRETTTTSFARSSPVHFQESLLGNEHPPTILDRLITWLADSLRNLVENLLLLLPKKSPSKRTTKNKDRKNKNKRGKNQSHLKEDSPN